VDSEDEKIFEIIRKMDTDKRLASLEKNIRLQDKLTPDVEKALKDQYAVIGREMVAKKTGIDLSDISSAEEKIVQAVSEYVGLQKRDGKNASRTLGQIRNRGLIEAAEVSVSKSKPTQGFEVLNGADRSDLSYEQIIIDHPEEFSARALWYARRTLGLPSDSDKPPASAETKTQERTEALLNWLWQRRVTNTGSIPPFKNAEAAAAIGMNDLARFGRVHGNVQSRLDFACYMCELPPLGLTAEALFEKAWQSGDTTWDFPITEMQVAAQSWRWSQEQFDLIRAKTRELPGSASVSWKKEMAENLGAVRQWAERLKDAGEAEGEALRRNPPWTRDELILALDFYLQHRKAIPGKTSDAVSQLSSDINTLAKRLGLSGSNTLRNVNGVYMKLMNFRSHDPDYTDQGKSGLTRGNREEKVIWDQFAEDPERLKRLADTIRAGLSIEPEPGTESDEPEIAEAEEGRLITRLHRTRERSRAIVQKKKLAFEKQHGRLFCEACGFDFADAYGDRGRGFIECHHTKPVHSLSPGEKTSLDDLALLCANCHRMVHAKAPWLSMEALTALLSSYSGNSR